ncbi:MAG: hypothetical protein KDD47_21790, partial [Acidobacteria bacterium]|nr:hypothetical protein [Acidobacteriota bacterium]
MRRRGGPPLPGRLRGSFLKTPPSRGSLEASSNIELNRDRPSARARPEGCHEVSSQGEITGLLSSLRQGEKGVVEQLLPLVYNELHALAHRQLRRMRPGQTLNTTSLVHEA